MKDYVNMTTQLAIDLPTTAPLQSRPVVQPEVCPVRGRCLLAILAKNAAYACGFEQANTVDWCPKRRGVEG